MRKAEREHVNKVAELGCVACYVQAGVWGTPGEIHHIRAGQGAAQRAGWYEVLCLCVGHHRHDDKRAGKIAVHGNTGYKTFTSTYGSEQDLLNLTLENI
ncbi:Ref family recombination enhancement nuclease [Klebsiella aerogenes]